MCCAHGIRVPRVAQRSQYNQVDCALLAHRVREREAEREAWRERQRRGEREREREKRTERERETPYALTHH
jgi:hypothetical protein